jgi:hypothetical protein
MDRPQLVECLAAGESGDWIVAEVAGQLVSQRHLQILAARAASSQSMPWSELSPPGNALPDHLMIVTPAWQTRVVEVPEERSQRAQPMHTKNHVIAIERNDV